MVILQEMPGLRFFIGLAFMVAATVLLIKDTLDTPQDASCQI